MENYNNFEQYLEINYHFLLEKVYTNLSILKKFMNMIQV